MKNTLKALLLGAALSTAFIGSASAVKTDIGDPISKFNGKSGPFKVKIWKKNKTEELVVKSNHHLAAIAKNMLGKYSTFNKFKKGILNKLVTLTNKNLIGKDLTLNKLIDLSLVSQPKGLARAKIDVNAMKVFALLLKKALKRTDDFKDKANVALKFSTLTLGKAEKTFELVYDAVKATNLMNLYGATELKKDIDGLDFKKAKIENKKGGYSANFLAQKNGALIMTLGLLGADKAFLKSLVGKNTDATAKSVYKHIVTDKKLSAGLSKKVLTALEESFGITEEKTKDDTVFAKAITDASDLIENNVKESLNEDKDDSSDVFGGGM